MVKYDLLSDNYLGFLRNKASSEVIDVASSTVV